ncbi:hypothetical protein A3Q56_02080 [Intoshia linei]|uniref:Uncharacterized protein n=1 Tax=Intoshia linei TaxID=1819745 RepID=A0A177B9S0_9BILA|nr:hypothetical protein A3Q56_02080 [Intoshia linei]
MESSDARRRSSRPRKSIQSFDYDSDQFEDLPVRKKKKSSQDIVNLYKSCARKPTEVKKPITENMLKKSSADLCKEMEILDTVIENTHENFQKMSTYISFSQNLRRKLTKNNPKVPISSLVVIINAKWREFSSKRKEFYGIETNTEKDNQSSTIDVTKSEINEMDSSDGRASKSNSSDEESAEIDEIETVFAKPSSLSIRLGRKAKRKRKHSSDDETKYTEYNTSDEEFERQLEEINSIEAAEGSTTSSKSKSRTKLSRAAKKKDTYDSEHENFCTVCLQGGEIILCDNCPKAYHTICLKPDVEIPSHGKWKCPNCEIEKAVELADPEGVIVHRTICNMCRSGENLFGCSKCPRSFHLYCVFPYLEDDAVTNWVCPCCSFTDLGRKVHKIITWRFVDNVVIPEVYKDIPDKHKFREFLVKWHNKSYMECTWITDFEYDSISPNGYRIYMRRNDMEDVPITEEMLIETPKSDESLSLEEYVEKNFVRYGIRIEWLTIHKILCHKKYEDETFTWYFVKWRELPYSYCTWETDQDDILEFQKCIEDYWSLREIMLNPNKTKKKHKKLKRGKKLYDEESKGVYKKNPSSPITDLKKKYESQPTYLGGTLHDYQMDGLHWLRYSWYHDTHTILADEMGLGKTIQTIAFLYSLYKEGHCTGPFLIAAPLSTIVNWERETEFWAPEFYAITYTGDKESRRIIREYELSFDEGIIRGGNKASKVRNQNLKFHVMLTSYEMVAIDQATLGSINWQVLVVDEAHRLKNNQSRFFKVMQGYSISYKLLLTGTPLQNNLEELFHLLNFLEPKDFYDCAGFLDNFKDIAKEDQIKKLHDMLGPHLLRRLKVDVLKSMPSKHELIVRVDLSAMQKKYYKFILTRNYEALSGKGSSHVSLLNVMMDLKKCCNHPYLFPSASFDAARLPHGAYEQSGLVKAADKMVLLQKMLKRLFEDGHRVLIFSQMTKMLDLLEDFCEGANYKYERIDGGITGTVRQDAIDRFNAPNSEKFIFLLSTRAGGLGINLASADTVFIYDSDWNPHNDIQAFSRAHRIGQVNQVMIYRFVTKNSVEERITEVAKRKMMLTHLVVRPGMGGSKTASVSKKELDDILKFGTEDLFKDDDAAENEKNIFYDDAVIEQLLNRDRKSENEDKEESMNQYLSSFKVAQYKTEYKESEETDNDNDEATNNSELNAQEESDIQDTHYWDRLLRHHYEQEVENQNKALGKGKRIRKQVNYNDQNLGITSGKRDYKNNPNWSPKISDVDSIYSGDQEDDDVDFEDFDSTFNKGKRKLTDKDKKLPPLIVQNNNQVDVFGFNTRQRRAFLNAILRYGLPPNEVFAPHWLVRDLRGKSQAVFKAYTQMFMRHLCENVTAGKDYFSDGVPRENLNRHQVLTRIGIMSLIRKKVQEFEVINGKYCIPGVVLVNNKLILNKNAKSTLNVEDSDKDTKSDRAVLEINQSLLQTKKFVFNIADGNFTEIHTLWVNEDRVVLEEGKLIWNKYHDYWLLRGIVSHGYGRWYDIQSDIQFAIINQPFEHEGKDQNLEYKNKFLSRRFKLIEQALIVEEQLRRAAFLKYNEDPHHAAYDLSNKFAKLEALADSNQYLARESVCGNRPANLVLHKVLNQLEELLSEMKLDLNRIPAALARLAPVSDRLKLNESDILNKLCNGIKYVNKLDDSSNGHTEPIESNEPETPKINPIENLESNSTDKVLSCSISGNSPSPIHNIDTTKNETLLEQEPTNSANTLSTEVENN